MVRSEKPTREMGEPLPPMSGFDWPGLQSHVERIEQMIKLTQTPCLEIESVPEEFVGQAAEVLRDKGHEVFQGRNRLRILIKEAS
jgi:hypothetical protein